MKSKRKIYKLYSNHVQCMYDLVKKNKKIAPCDKTTCSMYDLPLI